MRRFEPGKRKKSIHGKSIIVSNRRTPKAVRGVALGQKAIKQSIASGRNQATSDDSASPSAEAQFRSSLNELELDAKDGKAIPEIIKNFICSDSLQPSSVYKDGQEHWCFDWDDDALECCVYTKYLAAENRLLVIVDTNDGSFLRLPCNLSGCEPLKHLRLALKIAVGGNLDG